MIHARPAQLWNAKTLAQELRNNAASVAQYLQKLENLSIVNKITSSSEEYSYNSSNTELHALIEELSQAYRVHTQSVIESIYSPLKKARDFSQAFVLGGKKEDSDG